MPMRANRMVHRLAGYLIEGAVWGDLLHTKSFSVPLPPPLLPIACLNFEQTIAGISISTHFQTVAANSNNFQTHPVCNLLSTNEINPSENIFNNNVMQNGISKVVKSGRFSQFLIIGPHYITQGGGGGVVEYTSSLQSGTEELLLSSRKVHPPDLAGSMISWLVWGYLGWGGGGADPNLDVPRRWGGGGGDHLAADKFRQGRRVGGESLWF